MRFTDDQLRATFDAMRPHRENWPATFEEARRLPLVRSILESMTLHPGALARWLAQHQKAASVSLDWKRRASGEKESDFD
jgi:hypothetical protein